MYKVGDKFIIEIGGEYVENPFGNGENGKSPTILHKIKGFDSLVFDKNGLKKLEKYEPYSIFEEASYEKGLNDVWECLKKIRNSNEEELREIFNLPFATTIKDVLNNCTPQEAIDKLKEWEEKHEIKVGDVVSYKLSNRMLIVTRIYESDGTFDGVATNGEMFGDRFLFDCKKTGKHIDLTEIFKGLEGEDGD